MRFLFHLGFLSILHMASKKERLTMFWALCQCRAARIIKLWPYFSRSHELFLIPVSSLPVLAECPLDNHSSFLGPGFNSHLLWETLLYSQGSCPLPGFSLQYHLGVLLQTAAHGPDGCISFSAAPGSQRVCAWEQEKEAAGGSIPVLLTLLLFSLLIQGER